METKEKYLRLLGKSEQLQNTIKQKASELKYQKQRQLDIEKAQVLLQVTAQETQETFKVHLEDIVQTALDTCFPGKYCFCIEFLLKRGSTICDIYLEDECGFRTDPMTAAGGGVVDIIALALRIAVWTLTRPDNILVLDEPFKWLSANLRPLAGEIIQKLSRKLGIQFLIVTHDPNMVDISDKIFRVRLNKKGISKVTVLEGDK